jgi:hypothetical protein
MTRVVIIPAPLLTAAINGQFDVATDQAKAVVACLNASMTPVCRNQHAVGTQVALSRSADGAGQSTRRIWPMMDARCFGRSAS